MNKKLFSAALLLSALPLLAASAAAGISLNQSDFLSARKIVREGHELVSLKLSKSGKAKIRQLNRESVGQPVHTAIGADSFDFTFRGPIKGDGLELGPVSPEEATRVATAINGQ